MKVLFLPENIASMPAISAAGLAKKNGVEAKCIVLSLSKYQAINEHVIFLPPQISKRKPLKWLYYQLTYKRRLKKWIDWADIIHYTWGPVFKDFEDLDYAFNKGKVIFVEWLGSEIRDPEFIKDINPYYKKAFENGYEYAKSESREQSIKNQQSFAKYKAIPLLCPEMSLYVDMSLFEKTYQLYQRIDIRNFTPVYPAINNNRPLIVHSPTAKMVKGNNFIIPLMEELKKDYDFEFVLLHDISRERVLEIMQKADIILDQIIVGGYGMAAIEGMSFGKPVMCHLIPEVFGAGLPDECPIVNTNPDNLKEQLIKLIRNPVLRNEIGIKSRAFAEQFHNVEIVADRMLEIYKTELERQKHNV